MTPPDRDQQVEKRVEYRVVGDYLGGHHVTESFIRPLAMSIYRAWESYDFTENVRLQSSTDGVNWEDVADV